MSGENPWQGGQAGTSRAFQECAPSHLQWALMLLTGFAISKACIFSVIFPVRPRDRRPPSSHLTGPGGSGSRSASSQSPAASAGPEGGGVPGPRSGAHFTRQHCTTFHLPPFAGKFFKPLNLLVGLVSLKVDKLLFNSLTSWPGELQF